MFSRFWIGLMAVLVTAAMVLGDVPQAPKPPQAPPLEERVTKVEEDIKLLKKEIAELKATKVPAMKSSAPVPVTSTRVQINGLWYDKFPDGRLAECVECNRGKAGIRLASVKGDDFVINPDDVSPGIDPGVDPFDPGGQPNCQSSSRFVEGQPVRNAFRFMFHPFKSLRGQ